MISPAASSSALRILRADGTVVGAGFLVDAQHVFTCAHVVAEALGLSPFSPTLPNQPILLDFPLLPSTPRLRAHVTVWQPVNEDWNGGDIVGLALLDAAPEGTQPVTFAPTTDVWGHDFRAFGFPAIADKGTWSTGRLLAEQGNGWIQIEDNRSGGVPITQGFSGAAVWDEQLEGVVGMVVATLHDPDGRVGGQAGIRVAFAIPQRLLLTAWPLIQPVTRPRVFLSAAQSDTDRRERLRAELEARGVLVWDEQHGPAGTPPEDEHGQQAIRAAMALLVVASNSTPSSLIVREHLRLAELYQRHIIFIRMAGASSTTSSHLKGADSSLTNPIHGEGTTQLPLQLPTPPIWQDQATSNFPPHTTPPLRGADSSLTSPVHGEGTTQLPPQLPTPPTPRWPNENEDESDTERKLAEIARQNLNFAWINARDSSDHGYKKSVKTIMEMLLERSSITALLDALTEQAEVPRNPYVGLRAFTARERADFFGREAFVEHLHAEIVRRLDSERDEKEERKGRLLTVIGASGSGKSSVVMAGLLPRLQEDAESKEWLYLSRIVPGSRPIEALVDTLSPHFPDASFRRLREDLTDDSTDGLHRLARQLTRREESGRRVVLFVDQFEELFTQTVSEEERRRFLDLLSTAASASDGALLILLTLRADFYSRLMEYPDFYALLAPSLYPLLPLQSSELRAAIARPAAQPDVQLSFEGDLLGDLLFDVQRQAGALPLLQFTLQQLYERRQGSRLTLKAYKEIGEVNGALARYAQATYESLPADQRELARILFLRLLEPGSAPEESTRRRASLSELAFSNPDQTRRMQAIIDTFISARLLTSSAYPLTGQTTIEVSHEALIRAWPQLADWLRAARDDLPLQRKISEDAAQWQQNNQPPDRLYRGSQLKQARTWATRNILSVSKQEQTFLHASKIERVRVIVRWILVFLLIITSSGIAGWLAFSQSTPGYVTNTNNSGPGSLRWAIQNAAQDGKITFDPSLANQPIVLAKGDIHIQYNLLIQGLDDKLPIIISRAADSSIIIDSSASVTISNLVFKGNKARRTLSFLVNEGNLSLNNCYVVNNVILGSDTGVIYNSGSLNINKSDISRNINAGSGAGGIYNNGTLQISNSTISHNGSSGSGGAIENSNSNLTLITNTMFSYNTANYDGGGIVNDDSKLSIANSVFLNNRAKNSGGGIHNYENSTLTIVDSVFSNNTADDLGGGISDNDSTIIATNSIFSDNITRGSGGGLSFSWSTLNTKLIFCTLYHNKAARNNGSGIFLGQTAPGRMVVVNTRESIIAGEDADKISPIAGGMMTSGGYNLVQNMSAADFIPNTAHKTDQSVNNIKKIFNSTPTSLKKNGFFYHIHTLRLSQDNTAINAVPQEECIDDKRQRIPRDQHGILRSGRNKHGKPACYIGAFESSN